MITKMKKNCKTKKEHLNDSIKTAIIGGICIAVAVWLVLYTAGNPLHELALILHADTTFGYIVDAYEDVEEHDNGRPMWFHGGTYTYYLPDGRKFTQKTKESSGRLSPEFRNLGYPYPIEVEYLPNKPNISRIKGDGYKSITGLLFKITAGCFLLAMLSFPGVGLLWYGVRDLKRLLNENIDNHQIQLEEVSETLEV